MRSGNCLKVLYLANRLGLDHDWVDVDILAGETRRPEFLARNPAGQIPVVEFEDGRCLAQSNAILLYLARGSDLVPTEPWWWARMMEWLFWEQYSHEPAIAVCRFQKLYLGKPDGELDPTRVEKGNQALDRMENHLSAHTWLAGEALSVADISLVAYTRLAHEGGFDLATRPSVRRWIVDVERVLGL
jgi:glutathione S-transferase